MNIKINIQCNLMYLYKVLDLNFNFLRSFPHIKYNYAKYRTPSSTQCTSKRVAKFSVSILINRLFRYMYIRKDI